MHDASCSLKLFKRGGCVCMVVINPSNKHLLMYYLLSVQLLLGEYTSASLILDRFIVEIWLIPSAGDHKVSILEHCLQITET